MNVDDNNNNNDTNTATFTGAATLTSIDTTTTTTTTNSKNDDDNSDERLRKLLKPVLSEDDVMKIVLQYYYCSSSSSSDNDPIEIEKGNVRGGIQIIRSLDSYDDCNYQIQMNNVMYLFKVSNGVESNEYCNSCCIPTTGTTTTNNQSSSLSSVIHLQHAIMNVLQKNNITTTVPVPPVTIQSTNDTNNSNDTPTTTGTINTTDPVVVVVHVPVVCTEYSPYPCVVRLFTWVYGIPMSNISSQYISLHTFINIGQQLGYINIALDQLSIVSSSNDSNNNNHNNTTSATTTTATTYMNNIHIPAQRYHQWDTKNTCDLYPTFTQYIPNEQRRTMIESIIDTFRTTFIHKNNNSTISNSNTTITSTKQQQQQPKVLFRKGIIMGDYNDANIILQKCTDDNNNDNEGYYTFAGVIDFGDSVESWRVLDVTIAMAYAMLSSYGKSNHASISAAATLLRGYHSVYPLQDIEQEHLVLLIACRLACSTTLGAFSLQQNPNNTYLLLHSEPAWKALELIWGYNVERRQQMKIALDRIFHQACNYSSTPSTATANTSNNYVDIPCYDLLFPDPSIPDPLANVRFPIRN